MDILRFMDNIFSLISKNWSENLKINKYFIKINF